MRAGFAAGGCGTADGATGSLKLNLRSGRPLGIGAGPPVRGYRPSSFLNFRTLGAMTAWQ